MTPHGRAKSAQRLGSEWAHLGSNQARVKPAWGQYASGRRSPILLIFSDSASVPADGWDDALPRTCHASPSEGLRLPISGTRLRLRPAHELGRTGAYHIKSERGTLLSAYRPGRSPISRASTPATPIPPLRVGPQSRMPADARSKVFRHAYKTPRMDEYGGIAVRRWLESRVHERLRRALPEMLKDLGVRTLVDIPCGDWNWMSQVELPVEKYIGGDLVPDVVAANQARFGNAHVEFRVFDLCADPLPPADLLLCRDALVHFSFADIWDAIENIVNAEIRLLASTTFPETRENIDIETGIHWRPLNLDAPPFSFPPCLCSFVKVLLSGNSRYGAWATFARRSKRHSRRDTSCRCRAANAIRRDALHGA